LAFATLKVSNLQRAMLPGKTYEHVHSYILHICMSCVVAYGTRKRTSGMSDIAWLHWKNGNEGHLRIYEM